MTDRPLYRLVGVHNQIGVLPTFVTPIFTRIPPTNTWYIQVIDEDGWTVEFEPTSIETRDLLGGENDCGGYSHIQDQKGVWAFAFSPERIIIGSESRVRQELSHCVDEPEIRSDAYLYLDVVNFLDDHKRQPEAFRE